MKRVVIDNHTGLILSLVNDKNALLCLDGIDNISIIEIKEKYNFYNNITPKNLENYYLKITRIGLDILMEDEISNELINKKSLLMSRLSK